MNRWMLRIAFLAIVGFSIIAGEKGLFGNINILQLIIVLLFILIGIIGVGVIIISLSTLKKQDISYEVHPLTTPIPVDISDLHMELQSLGFTLCGELHISDNLSWNYFNVDHDVTVGLDQEGHVTFSSYFSDGLDISTVYPSGMNITSDNIRIRIVESSVTEAFDFHLHHIGQYVAEHGKPRSFADFVSVVAWGEQHKYMDAIQTQISKFGVRNILIGGFQVFSSILGIILILMPWSLVNLILSLIIAAIGGYLSSVLMGSKKITESVESRKKRKAKEVESPEVA